MSETPTYEFAYDPLAEFDIPEPDDQVPEYINPDWNDDTLFGLISTNQDVVVEVDGCLMTLSAAMNQHPGPWTPENEPNLIAYAEGLLAGSLPEPEEVEEPALQELEPEKISDVPEQDERTVQDLARPDRAIDKPSQPDSQEDALVPRQIETRHPVDEPALHAQVDTTAKDMSELAGDERESPGLTKKADISSHEKASPDATEQVVKVVSAGDAEQVEAAATSRPTHQPVIERPETIEALKPDSDTTIMTDEGLARADAGFAEEASAAELPAPDGIETYDGMFEDELIGATQTELVYEVVDETAAEEVVWSVLYEIAYESSDEKQERILNEQEIDPLSESAPALIIDEGREIEYEKPETGDEKVDGVVDVFVTLAELIESEALVSSEDVGLILNDFFEAQSRSEITTKEEWQIIYAELFSAAGMSYPPEFIESLATLTVKWHLIEEIERLEEAGFDTSSSEENSAKATVRKLLAAFTNIVQAIRHIFAIGTYALGLSVVPRVGFQ